MRWLRGDCGCDSLDIAAAWPAFASLGGMQLPDLNSALKDEREPEEKMERL